MGKIALVAVAALLLILAGGIAFLAIWDIPAPSTPIEKVLPDAKFPK